MSLLASMAIQRMNVVGFELVDYTLISVLVKLPIAEYFRHT